MMTLIELEKLIEKSHFIMGHALLYIIMTLTQKVVMGDVTQDDGTFSPSGCAGTTASVVL